MTLSTQHDSAAILAHETRRHFLSRCATGLGAFWLAEAGLADGFANAAFGASAANPAAAHPSELVGRAKHVIYLHMTGAPSQVDLFDYKPDLVKFSGQPCPQSFLQGKRFAFITGTPQLLGPLFPFHREAKTGHWISDRLPHLEPMLEELCIIKSMQSEQFNHAPAQLLILTGNQNLGYASLGSWAMYGLGSENQNLPGFIVLMSGGNTPDAGKAGWSSGFLPSVYQGVQCRGAGDPVLYLSNPPGVTREMRGSVVDAVSRINERTYERVGDPETLTRVSQYELAFRMQMSATDAMDLGQETAATHAMYGTQPGKECYANNCLLARRLVERGVRFVQLFDWGWDHHTDIDKELPNKCREVDQPTAALLTDLKQRGLLDETLVIWSGEFGRTPMQENRGGVAATSAGRDHHIDSFALWMAGGGVKRGTSYGETDAIGFGVAENPVPIRDLHATVLRLLGLQFDKLTFPFQGLNQKLTGVKPARVVEELLA